MAVAKRLDHVDGIQAARATFPHCWIDADRCEYGIEVLRNYHYEWDEEKKCFNNMPAHDWSSHGASAFRTLALSWKHPRTDQPNPPLIDRLQAQSIQNVTYGDLRKKLFDQKRRERNGETVH